MSSLVIPRVKAEGQILSCAVCLAAGPWIKSQGLGGHGIWDNSALMSATCLEFTVSLGLAMPVPPHPFYFFFIDLTLLITVITVLCPFRESVLAQVCYQTAVSVQCIVEGMKPLIFLPFDASSFLLGLTLCSLLTFCATFKAFVVRVRHCCQNW